LGLDAGSYQARFGEEVLGSLFRQPGGHYRADRPEVLLPFTSPRPIVTLTDVAGCSVATQAFDLWNPTADVTVLRAKSEKAAEDLSAKDLKPNLSYVLLTASDLIVEPSQTVWRRLGHQNAQRLILVPREWSPDLRVVDRAGTLLWQARLSQQLVVRGEPVWAKAVKACWQGDVDAVELGRTVNVVILGLAPGIEVISLRLGGRPLNIRPGREVTAKVEATPQLALGELRLGIGLRCRGELVHVHRALPAVIVGAARFKAKGWEALDRKKKLTVREARDGVFRLFLASDQADRKVALIEGPRLAGWLGERPGPMSYLAGLGAPLAACREPYNDPDPLFQLAASVIDYGVVRFVEYHKQHEAIQIRLTNSISPGPGHQIVWWAIGLGISVVGHETITVLDNGLIWRVPCPWPESVNLSVAGIAYEGRWLGSACPGNCVERLFEAMVPNAAMAPQAAAMVRWFRLPILLRTHDTQPPTFEAFALSHPASTLAAWLFDEVPGDLPLAFDEAVEVGEGAWAALRVLFAGWEAQPEVACSIVEKLARFTPTDPLTDLVRWLMPKDPMLTGCLVRGWYRHKELTKARRAVDEMATLRLVRQALGLGHAAEDRDVSRRLDALLEQAVVATGRHEYFFREVAREALEQFEGRQASRKTERNLEVALQVGSFRHYFGARVLDWIAHHL
jgi:hypothetical protein